MLPPPPPPRRLTRDAGAWSLENILQGLQGLSLSLFTQILGWTPERLELFLVEVRKDFRNTSMHGYWQM